MEELEPGELLEIFVISKEVMITKVSRTIKARKKKKEFPYLNYKVQQ